MRDSAKQGSDSAGEWRDRISWPRISLQPHDSASLRLPLHPELRNRPVQLPDSG